MKKISFLKNLCGNICNSDEEKNLKASKKNKMIIKKNEKEFSRIISAKSVLSYDERNSISRSTSFCQESIKQLRNLNKDEIFILKKKNNFLLAKISEQKLYDKELNTKLNLVYYYLIYLIFII